MISLQPGSHTTPLLCRVCTGLVVSIKSAPLEGAEAHHGGDGFVVCCVNIFVLAPMLISCNGEFYWSRLNSKSCWAVFHAEANLKSVRILLQSVFYLRSQPSLPYPSSPWPSHSYSHPLDTSSLPYFKIHRQSHAKPTLLLQHPFDISLRPQPLLSKSSAAHHCTPPPPFCITCNHPPAHVPCITVPRGTLDRTLT